MKVKDNFKCPKCGSDRIASIEKAHLYSEVLEYNEAKQFNTDVYQVEMPYPITAFLCKVCKERFAKNYNELYDYLQGIIDGDVTDASTDTE